ncbi:MAG: alpha/beta hydrolase [Patescibacteria group bacterium]|jgi:pimeloyl-ACP methyl ester carboxylesterase
MPIRSAIKQKRVYIPILCIFIVVVLPYLIPLRNYVKNTSEDSLDQYGAYIYLDNQRIYYETAGPINGPAIVFMHGFGGWSGNWRPMVQKFGAAGSRVVAFDRPGFGLSDQTRSTQMSNIEQVNASVKVFDALGIDRTVIIAHSLGAQVGLQLAAEHPERVSGLLIVDGSIRERCDWIDSFGVLLKIPFLRRWAEVGLSAYLTPGRFDKVLQTAISSSEQLSVEAMSRYNVAVRTPDWQVGVVSLLRDRRLNVLSDPITKLTMPVGCVWGVDDSWASIQIGQKLCDQLSAEFIPIEKSGHLPMEEQPELFYQSTLNFINKIIQ